MYFRKYYNPYSGYLAPTLEHYAEALYNVGRIDEAKVAMDEAQKIMQVIPGEDSYLYQTYFIPKCRKIFAISKN